MRAAKTRAGKQSQEFGEESVLPSHGLPAALQELLDTPRTAEQQAFIDTLPIAIALIGLIERKPVILARNRAFLELSERKPRFVELDHGHGLCSGLALPLVPQLDHFLASGQHELSFDMQEGDGIGGRHFAVRLARLEGGDSSAPRCIMSLIDRTQQVDGERSLRSQMLRDSLTGLPNRAAFAEQVEHAMENFASDQRQFAVLLVDLTRFSRVNEGVGSLAGDELIITVARRLISALRAGDMLARLAGDEFAVLLGVTGESSEAMRAARRMQACLATPIRLGELEIKIDCAVGVAMMSTAIDTAEDLIRNAQFAMKRAKHSGHAEIYQACDSAAARERFSLETELRRAIERDQLQLAFQPLISLASGQVTGFEALARWHHPEKGVISPAEFIPVAEESGLIVPLGRWALRAATRTLLCWQKTQWRGCARNWAMNIRRRSAR